MLKKPPVRQLHALASISTILRNIVLLVAAWLHGWK